MTARPDAIDERRAALKAALRGRRRVFAGWDSLGHPQLTEMICGAGVDFVGIDMEHTTISHEQARDMTIAAQSLGALALPRVPSHEPSTIRRLLDSGADGIIAPVVESRAQVDALVEAMKYPPVGRRGYGVSRAQGYGADFDAYTSSWNEVSSLIVQIETMAGVEAAGEIVSHPEVDGVIVGPYDISGSLGIPGRIDDPAVTEASARVAAACETSGKSCGTHLVVADEAGIAGALEAGFTLLLLASDVFVMWKWAEATSRLVSDARRG